jgi:hypothetical protein
MTVLIYPLSCSTVLQSHTITEFRVGTGCDILRLLARLTPFKWGSRYYYCIIALRMIPL